MAGSWRGARLPSVKLLLVLVASLATLTAGCRGTAVPAVTEQRLAVPAYFPPGPLWQRLEEETPIPGIVIVNPASGPGVTTDDALRRQIRRVRQRGVTVIGYVATGHGQRPLEQVRADIDRFFALYEIDGIFVDEASTSCDQAGYYQQIATAVRQRGAQQRVVLNPGRSTGECFAAFSDILVTFEGSFETYQRQYEAAPWIGNYAAGRFWHLVYGVATLEQIDVVRRLSRQRGAGWVYFTPDNLPNPWDSLAPAPFLSATLPLSR